MNRAALDHVAFGRKRPNAKNVIDSKSGEHCFCEKPAPTFSRNALVAEARSWIGTPYRHQASLKGVGCDCLGLVRGLWRASHGGEPEALRPYAPDWALGSNSEWLAGAARRHLIERSLGAEEPGDVLLFRWRDGLPASHAAILSHAEHMVHAHDGAAVAEVALTRWWRRHLVFVFTFPGVAT